MLEDAETLHERLDALHPLPSDILTNSGAPRTDNYFCGPRRPRLPRVFIYPGPRASSTLLLSLARYQRVPSPSYIRPRRFFAAESRRSFVPFFLRGPEGPGHVRGRKRVRGVVKHAWRFKSPRDTREYEPPFVLGVFRRLHLALFYGTPRGTGPLRWLLKRSACAHRWYWFFIFVLSLG